MESELMDNPFVFAMQNVVNTDTTTANGLQAFSQTNSELVDLYYRSVRNISKEDLTLLLNKAWRLDPLRTLKLIFIMRDSRGLGKGDRDSFVKAFDWLIDKNFDVALKSLQLIPEYGSYLDLVKLATHETIGKYAATIISNALREDNALAFKWCPRPDGKYDAASKVIRAALGMSEKKYRKYLTLGTLRTGKTVESQMCQNQWSEIRYPSVPSVAMKIYGKKAFPRHDETRFKQFLADVMSGKETIKSGQLYPYQLTVGYGKYSDVREAQWQTLLDKGRANLSLANTLCLCDTSGSMYENVSGRLQAIDVSKSLGLYFSSIIPEPWTNLLITFSNDPQFFQFRGESLYDKIEEMAEFSSFEGYGTDFIKVFALILDRARQHRLTQEQLPERVLVFSDNQFNNVSDMTEASRRISITKRIKEMFADSGYVAPMLAYWNLNGSYDNFPATSDEDGVMLISGFSPDAAKAFLVSGEVDPTVIVYNIIDSARYERIAL
jgi:hypothetical protein